MKKIVYLLMMFQMWSCAPLSVNRTFVDAMEDEQDEYMVPGRNFDLTAGDTGRDEYSEEDLRRRTPRAEHENIAWSEEQKLKQELDRKIASLTPEKRNAFRRAERHFQNDSQKIYYLGLSDYERKEYMDQISPQHFRSARAQGRSVASALKYSPRRGRTVAMGMDKSQVVQSWGNPHRVDVAGDSSLENERWTFFESGKRKFVYFTKGKVEGWVTE